MTRQKLGQHFLGDAGWREKIARAIRVSPHGMQRTEVGEKNYCWIEIGAGHGEMTEHLLRSGARVIAVELDAALVPRLEKISQVQPNLRVVSGDVLQTNFSELAEGSRMRIYGNLPYYITSPILHHLFEYADQIDEIHIVIQLEVALRLTARPGTKLYGYLSVATQFYAHPEFVLRLPRGAFRPAPEVGSALVTLRSPGERATLGISHERTFLEFIKNCFAQKRKTLSNNLRAMASPGRVREILRNLRLREDARAEQLTVTQFAALYQAISSAPQGAGPDSRS